MPIESIPPGSLQALLDSGEEIQMIDVREQWELDICRIAGSLNIPLATLPAALDELNREQPVAVICHHGMRSQQAAEFLAANGFSRIMNLQGGIEAWATQVDPAMQRY
jgi:rhodanese-related sulfurtransferase